MAKRPFYLVIAGLMWLGTMPSANAGDREIEVRAFTQAFYEWYAKTLDPRKHSVSTILRERPEILSPDLRAALEEDARARAHAEGYIVGVDFDPFIGGQDICERYTVGEILANGGSYRINVYSPCYSADHETPDVIAIVAWDHGRWTFRNFEYPETVNLEEILKQEADGRK